MKCTMDSIKNNRFAVGSLVVVGLTAVGAAAHKLGLLTLCSKHLSPACGHIAAFVQRHRIASIALAAVCLIGLAVLAVVYAKKGTPAQSSTLLPAGQTSTPLPLPTDTQELGTLRRNHAFGDVEDREQALRDLLDSQGSLQFIDRMMRNDTIDPDWNRNGMKALISLILRAYFSGMPIRFEEFFRPDYLQITKDESDAALTDRIQQAPDSQSIFPTSLEQLRRDEHGDLIEAIIRHYHTLLGKEILPGDSFEYEFKIWIDGKETPSSVLRFFRNDK